MVPKKIVIVHPHAAGIDLGSEMLFIATGSDMVQSFTTFTDGLEKACQYLQQQKVRTVAMEATGIYWVVLYTMLQERGVEVCLVNGAHVRNVPGRKSDVLDCQWLQQLHSYGLLRPSFIPDEAIRQLRHYVRLRDDHIEMGAAHVQHMHKALELMNLKLHKVISQIQGVSGLRIIEAILRGERSAERLVLLCDKQILKEKHQQVMQALRGHYREEHLFALQQALDGWKFYQEQMRACDRQIEAVLEKLTQALPDIDQISKPKAIRRNRPEVKELHHRLIQLHGGNDLSMISGMTDLSVLKFMSEVGTDMSPWKSEKHFTSWLGLAPGSYSSGKRRRQKGRRTDNRAGQILRECAQSIAKSKHLALSGFYQRIKAKRGAPIAMVAVARKLAVMYYRMLKYGIEYVEQGLESYQQRYEEQRLRYLKKQAQALGLVLVPAQP